MDDGPTISTHVLDTEHGIPAANVAVDLSRVTHEGSERVGGGVTDGDGRIRRLIDGPLRAGDYTISFRIGGAFFQELSISFRVTDTMRSYHVPLLVAPYSLASYRGS